MISPIAATTFASLMSIMIFSLLLVSFLLWKVVQYTKKNRSLFTRSNLIKTKGKIIKKFYGGGDTRISGHPFMTFKVSLDDNFMEIQQKVDQQLYFSYEEGDEIDLFVSRGQEFKIYPLEGLKE
jgi:hypothetical protein